MADASTVDGPFSQELAWVIELGLSLFFRLLAIILLTPVFFLPGVLVGIVGSWVGRVYMKAQLSVKREMSNAKAPVLGHFGAAIAGLSKSLCRSYSIVNPSRLSIYSCVWCTSRLQVGVAQPH